MVRETGLFSDESMTRSERFLHTPGNFARQNLLYVQEAGRLQSLTPHRCVRENLDSFLFFIVLEGKGSLTAGGRQYSIGKGDCAFVDCREHYEHISDGEDAWKLAWVHFNGHGAAGYFQLFFKYNQGSNIFSVQDTDLWNERIGEIMDAQKTSSFQRELRCGEMLLGLMNQIIDTVADHAAVENEQEREFAWSVLEALNEHYADSNVTGWLEEQFDCDIQDLSKIFSLQYGISVEEYISSRRLNAAKELLRFSVKPLEKVAEESGIRDLIAMQQLFRENEGVSAEEYRAKWAAWIR